MLVPNQIVRGRPWQPGQSGNPAGRPIGARQKIAELIINDIRVEWERSGAAILQRMAIEEPAKFAQLAAGLIPRETLLTVAQRLPGNLEGEDWELMLSVCSAIKQALPSGNQRQPSEVLNFVLDAIRQADAKLIAIYPLNLGDESGKPLDGANKYTISFEKGATPPANAFWSITLYDSDGFQVANSLNRFAVSSWMPFKYNADGSLDLYFQNESPGKDKEANWLPAPKGAFNLTMRLYGPKSEALTGKWNPPPITKVQGASSLMPQ